MHENSSIHFIYFLKNQCKMFTKKTFLLKKISRMEKCCDFLKKLANLKKNEAGVAQ
jgi:hypothetical protein